MADSTRWVIWFSISAGAAPGCDTETIAAGKSMSGLPVTSMRAKATMPASNSARNRTIGGTGLRMLQAEMLRKFMVDAASSVVSGRPGASD